MSVPLRVSCVLPNEWRLSLQRDADRSWLAIIGPAGEFASFDAPNDSVRADVVKEFMRGLVEHASQYHNRPATSAPDGP